MSSDADLRRALLLIVPYWRRLVLVLGISLVSTALSLSLPLLSKEFFDGALLGRDVASLARVALLFSLFTVATFALNIVSGLRYTRVSADILFDMRLAMYRHLLCLSPRFFAKTRMGDVMSRINNDLGELQRVSAEVVLSTIGNVLFLTGTVVMLLVLDWRLFALSTLCAPLSLWMLARYRGRLEAEVANVRQRSGEIGSFLIETLQAVRLVVTSNAQDREVERFTAKNAAFVSSLMSMQRLSYLSGGLPSLVLSFGSGLVFVYGGVRVINGEITIGTFVAFMAYHMRFLPPLQALMGVYASLATARVSLQRVSEILDAPIDVVSPQAPDVLGTVRGEIRFEHVTLLSDRETTMLDDVSFVVRPGDVCAIVGPSGSGKSTVADLMLRLVDPDAGCVRLDGRDVRTLNLTDLRGAVALVDQQPCLFHASIAENIRYAKPGASDAEVALAAQRAALDPVLAHLPQGLETVVGERGASLSMGERQRIALARAFLSDPAVLVLDEPSSALDPDAEQHIIAGYEAVMRGRTTVVITHRLDLAKRADRVVVLDAARVIERGSPHELQAGGGRFARLFQVQYGT